MSKTIHSGHSFSLSGTLTAGTTLTADSGSPGYPDGAFIGVHAAAYNQGTIALLGGPGYRDLDGATGGTLRITGSLTNTGLIDAAGGTDASGQRGAVGGGSVDIAASGSVANTGTLFFGGASSVYGGRHDGKTSGALLRDAGTLANAGALMIEGSSVSGHDAGATAIVGGVLTNTGDIAVGTGAGYSYGRNYAQGSRGGILRVLDTGTLINNGHISLGPGDQDGRNSLAAAAATLEIAGQFTNNAALGLYAGSGQYTQGGYALITKSGSMVNLGTITLNAGLQQGDGYQYSRSTPATLVNDGPLTNVGQIDLDSGGNDLVDGGVLTNEGTVSVAGGFENYHVFEAFAQLDIKGVLSNMGSIHVGQGYSRYDQMTPGGLLMDTGLIDNTGTISLGGSYFYNFAAVGGGTLDDAGVLTNDGEIVIAHGDSTRSGYDGKATLEIGGTLTNIGTLISPGVTYYGRPYYFDRASGLVSIAASGLLIDQGAIVNVGTVVNDGTLSSGAVGVTTGTVLASVANSGLIDVAASGAFDIDGGIYDTGAISIGGSGVLTLGMSIGSGQTIDLAGAQSTLALGKPEACYATIEGFGLHTTIDFLLTDGTSAKATGTIVTIGLASGGSFDLKLAAPLASYATLTLTSDGKGGTDLSVTGSSDVPPATTQFLDPRSMIGVSLNGEAAARFNDHPLGLHDMLR